MGMLGTLYGIFQVGGNTTARPLFFPMTLAFLYLLVLESPTDEESAKVLRVMTYVGAVYIGLAAVVNVGILPGLAAFKQFRNAQVAYVMIGIGGAYLMRRWWLFGSLLVLEAVNFAAYPSATSILCTIAMLVTFFITKPHGSRARPYVIGIMALFLGMIALAQLSEVSRITGDYFVAVGKVNANDGRLAIWGEGIHRWQASPFVGEMFTGGTVAQTYRTRNGQILQLPFHNDYVLFLAGGGILGLGLLIAFILSLNFTLSARLPEVRRTGPCGASKSRPTFHGGFQQLLRGCGIQPRARGALPFGGDLLDVWPRHVGVSRRWRSRIAGANEPATTAFMM